MEKEIICYYIKRLYDKKLTTMSGGNLSVKSENFVYVTPSEIDKGNLKTDDIMEVLNTGEIYGKHKVTSEFPVHKAVYEMNHDMNAILHSHTSSILGFSTAHILPKVKLLANVAYDLNGKIEIAKYADPGTKQLADETVKVLNGSNAVAILENHGLFIVDHTMEDCYDKLENLDLVCRIESNIKKIGGTPKELTEEQIDQYKNDVENNLTRSEEDNGGYQEERKLLAELLKRLYSRGISTCKNACFSWRLKNHDILVNPDNTDVTTLKPEDLVLIHDNKYCGEKKPHRDFLFHLSIYKNHDHINNVISSCPPYAMAYACSDQEYVTRVIAECYGYLRNIEKKELKSRSEMEELLKGYFDDYHNTVLIQNYACIVTGPHPLKTYDRMEVAESTAEAIIETFPVNKPVLMDQRAVEVIQKNCGIYPEKKE